MEEEEESDSDKPDWSDWEDVDHGNKEPTSIQQWDLTTSSQSDNRIGGELINEDQSRTSNENKENFDWSAGDDDWNNDSTDWSVTSSQKIHGGKKKTTALQLKSSAKKKDDDKNKKEPQSDLGSKQSGKLGKTAQKSSTPRQIKTATELGKEFDIPDITAVKDTEPDFFADMEPTVNFSGSGGGSSSMASSATKTESSKSVVQDTKVPKVETVSFAMEDTTVMVSRFMFFFLGGSPT